MAKEIIRPPLQRHSIRSFAKNVLRVGLVPTAIIASLSLTACSTSSQPSVDNSKFPQGVGLDGSPIQSTQQKEQLTAMQKQVDTAALNWLIKNLSSKQEYIAFGQDGGNIISKITSNQNSFPLNNIASGATIPKDSDLLTASWTYTENAYDNYVRKTMGEAEIKNFKFTAYGATTVSDADKANGIQWKGTTSLNYIERYRMRKFNFGDQNSYNDKATESDWAKANLLPPNGSFSEWKDSGMMLNLVLRSGVWEISQFANYYGASYPAPTIAYSGAPGVEDVYLPR